MENPLPAVVILSPVNIEENGAGSLEFSFDPPFTRSLRDEVSSLWVEVVNAGGTVVFAALPVSFGQALSEVEGIFASGRSRLLVAKLGGEVVGWVVIEHDTSGILTHRATIKRLMVSTEMSGKRIGRDLMRKANEVAREELGVSLLWLTRREETGLDEFYFRLGYTEMGRLPCALRIAPDGYRDEIFMCMELD